MVAEDVRGLSAVEFLRDLGIAVIGGIIAGVLSPALLLLARDRHRKAEEMRLLEAFMTLTKGELNAYASERETPQSKQTSTTTGLLWIASDAEKIFSPRLALPPPVTS